MMTSICKTQPKKYDFILTKSSKIFILEHDDYASNKDDLTSYNSKWFKTRKSEIDSKSVSKCMTLE